MATRKRRHRSARRRNPQSVLRRLIHRRRRNSWPDNAAGHRKAAILGWGRRKRRKTSLGAKSTWGKKLSRRRNPHYASYMPNPFRSYRRGRRHYRRNPLNLRRLLPNKALLNSSLKLGIGVTCGFVSMPIIDKIAQMTGLRQYSRYYGLGQIVLGSLMTAFIRNKAAKDIGIMIAGFGVYDLIATNLAPSYLQQLPRVQGITSMIPGLGTSYGVARAPVSRVAGAVPMAASYQPALASSYDSGRSDTVGLAGEGSAFGHLPGIDFDY